MAAGFGGRGPGMGGGGRPGGFGGQRGPNVVFVLDAETGHGTPNFCYGYMAQVIEVSVDIETGHVRVDRVTPAPAGMP